MTEKLFEILLILKFFLIPIVSFSFFSATSYTQISVASSVEIFPLDSTPSGLSYEEHIKNYWKMTLATPLDENHPWYDNTGDKCRVGQENSNSSIFYLPTNGEGDTLNRVCKIPAGLAIFIPIEIGEVSKAESPGATINDLDTAVRKDQDNPRDLLLEIDNTKLNHTEVLKYRTHTSPFNVTFAEPALFGVTPGPSVAVVGWVLRDYKATSTW